MSKKKYKINYDGPSGNAFAILGYVSASMREEGFSERERDEYIAKSTSGDYDNLCKVAEEMLVKLNEKHQES